MITGLAAAIAERDIAGLRESLSKRELSFQPRRNATGRSGNGRNAVGPLREKAGGSSHGHESPERRFGVGPDSCEQNGMSSG